VTTYRVVRLAKSTKEEGNCPLKLLLDKSLQKISGYTNHKEPLIKLEK
jgi:hypothetical protein